MSGSWNVWSIQRSDGAGLVVDEGTEAAARGSAAGRSKVAAEHGMADVVFIALPAGRQPRESDIPPLPADLAPAEPAAERTLRDVEADLTALAMAHHGFKAAPASTGVKVRRLVSEAHAMGVAEGRVAGRAALGKAWGAALELIPDEFWANLFYDDPVLWRRMRALVSGEPTAPAPREYHPGGHSSS